MLPWHNTPGWVAPATEIDVWVWVRLLFQLAAYSPCLHMAGRWGGLKKERALHVLWHQELGPTSQIRFCISRNTLPSILREKAFVYCTGKLTGHGGFCSYYVLSPFYITHGTKWVLPMTIAPYEQCMTWGFPTLATCRVPLSQRVAHSRWLHPGSWGITDITDTGGRHGGGSQ